MTGEQKAIAILERLRDAYHPPPDLKSQTISIYAEMLAAEFETEVIAQAATVLPKLHKFFPAIEEFRRTCLEVSGARAKIPATGEAYIEARRKASSIGAYEKPVAEDFSHRLVHRAAIQTSGSWRRWCLTEDEAPTRARFFEVYRELVHRELRQRALPPAARTLTAEESRALLEDLQARAERKALPAPAEGERKRRKLSELVKTFEHGVIGKDLSDEEWEARKKSLLEGA